MKLQRLPRVVTATTVALALAAPVASSTSAVAAPVAHAAAACNLAGKYTSLGPTYVERLSVTHTSCATGVSLIRSYNACRLKAGGVKGYCHSRIRGFRFTERRNSSSVQFVALVHATNGRAVVTFAYTENT